MIRLPDIETMRLCSVVATFSFGLVFAAVAQARRSDCYLRHWAASSFLYGAVLLLFEFMQNMPWATTILLGLLGLTSVLLVSGTRCFDGRAPFRGWMVVPIAAPMLGQAVPMLMGRLGWIAVDDVASRIGTALGLTITAAIAGLALMRAHSRRGADGRSIAGAALLGYIPAYVLSIAGEMGAFTHSNLLGVLPMLSDQLLLGVLNLGLLMLPVRRAEAQLREAALRDPLTGVWNRLGLAAQQTRLLQTDAAVIAIDADHFKGINDRHGHAAGDEVLIAIAREAGGCASAFGGELARTGGDEFVVILPAASAGAAFFAERLRATLAAVRPGPAWTVSLGIASVAAGEVSFAPALKRADESLYLAKAGGRDRIAA